MNPNRSTEADARAACAQVFDELSPRVFAYARRHCGAGDAQDVVAETFLVAWRRWDEIPDDPLPWLLVVARNTIRNQRRSLIRRRNLTESAQHIAHLASSPRGADHQVVARDELLTALNQLTDLEREAVLLVAWDGLANVDAARVAGCSQRAFDVRLSRARARMRRSLATTDTDTDTDLPRVSAMYREARS